jgi:hypothetical protein
MAPSLSNSSSSIRYSAERAKEVDRLAVKFLARDIHKKRAAKKLPTV